MLKVFDTPANFFSDEPNIRILDVDSAKGLMKQAADSRIQKFASTLKSSPDKIYVHILAMGASEFYGANLNLDYFPEENLKACYKTFETNPAYIYFHHVNKNPATSMGKIIFAIFNERMHRVELVGEIDRIKSKGIVERIERGDFPSTSMACKTPKDVCSICGNEATTRQKYCTHLRNELGRIYPDGRRVMAINSAPLSFHDLSYVYKGADVTSSFLQKLASEGDAVIGSAERAEMEGLVDDIEKRSAFRKISELVKEITDGGHIVGSSDQMQSILDQVKDPEEKTLDALGSHNLKDVFTTFGYLGISPSLGFLAELIGRKLYGHGFGGIGKMVHKHLSEHGINEDIEISADMFKGDTEGKPSKEIAVIIAPSVGHSSLLPEFVEKRATMVPGTNVGYIGNGPTIAPTLQEKLREEKIEKLITEEKGPSLLVRLISLGAAALAAKWYISSVINEKMKQGELSDNSGIKIVLVKQASEYRSTYFLSMADTARCIKAYVKASKN
jgi:hypothetical protein